MKMPATPPPSTSTEIKRLVAFPERFRAFLDAGITPAPGGQYRHWDTLRHLTPPKGLTSEDWWLGIKMARRQLYRLIPLRNAQNTGSFRFGMPDIAHERCHFIDRDASGRIALAEEVANSATRDQYLVASLMDEAITSSQLEGASTTRQVAKEMLRTGRPPRDKDERMIMNNFRAMNRVQEIANEPLSEDRVFELHRMLTEGTLDPADGAGRYRRAEEAIVVGDMDGETLHTPPPAAQLEERMATMISFANGAGMETFVHPVVRSILLHFWLAYDHPFVDGNGRTARALFYWSMLKHGYWLIEYLSISKILRKAPARYARSFHYCETDDDDATYFVLSQMAVIQRAIQELHVYLQSKMREMREIEALMKKSVPLFNHRQLALLTHAQKHPDSHYTIEAHAMSQRVAYETARQDLLHLERKKLLARKKVGKTFYFSAPRDLSSRLKKI